MASYNVAIIRCANFCSSKISSHGVSSSDKLKIFFSLHVFNTHTVLCSILLWCSAVILHIKMETCSEQTYGVEKILLCIQTSLFLPILI